MSQNTNVPRRGIMKSLLAGSAFAFISRRSVKSEAAPAKLKGRIKQCVCRGFWGKYPWDEFLPTIKQMGLVGVDLVGQGDWGKLKEHGMISSMSPGAGSIKNGLNNPEMHEKYMETLKKNLKDSADNGWPNVIVMAGDRKGISDEEGMDNCYKFLMEGKKIAEDLGVTMCMELLNSKVDHPGYMCDHTAWGVELCKRVNSPRFKLLYDIYHMQIMEGDLIRTIRDNIDHIAHFHTAGNPGRKDMDNFQELNYTGIMEAIAKLTEEGKFNGFVAHEFGPKHKFDSLQRAIEICDV